MFNKKEYYVKRYNTDEKYREKILKAVLNYQNSEKGKVIIKKYKKKFKKEHPDYYKNYAKKHREDAKKAGICINCFKNKVSEYYYTCDECRAQCKVFKENKKLKNEQNTIL